MRKIKFNVQQLARALELTKHAIAKSESQPNLAGYGMTIDGTTVTVEATDDHRAVRYEFQNEEGVFPEMKDVYPQGESVDVTFNVPLLLRALKTIIVMQGARQFSVPCKLSVDERLVNQLEDETYPATVEGEPELNGTSVKIHCSREIGPSIAIAVNAKYLADMLSSIIPKSHSKRIFQTIIMKTYGDLNAVVFETESIPGYKSVIMPLRIEW